MINQLKYLRDLSYYVLPMLFFLWRNRKAALKKEDRSRQFLFPVIAPIYCYVVYYYENRVEDIVEYLFSRLPVLISWIGSLIQRAAGNNQVTTIVNLIADLLQRWIDSIDPKLLVFATFNAGVLWGFMFLKRFLRPVIRRIFKDGNFIYEKIAGFFYEVKEDGKRYLKREWIQTEKLLRYMYYGTTVLTSALAMLLIHLYLNEQIDELYYPVYALVIVAELCYYLRGSQYRKAPEEVEAPEEERKVSIDYSGLRAILKRIFGDKLLTDETTSAADHPDQPEKELLDALVESKDVVDEAYGIYLRRKASQGLELDRSYVRSGQDLLHGHSILFNNPFYYDLLPYLFYPMNRTILTHKKILIICGRHGEEKDIEIWCERGFKTVSNIPDLWHIGVLREEEQDLDVGIVTRSSVHDLSIHEANKDFFEEVGFVVLIEPSRLLPTAQVGLRSLVQHCQREGKQITYSSFDKNCDGLLDALSHVLMTNLTEVSASNHHKGASSYMCWDVDDERLQNRLVPNITSYLGMGTELSFAALKHQVPRIKWYGGDAIPVYDIKWIAKQYYYSLLGYANRPTNQMAMDRLFQVDSNLWNAKIEKDQYITVEDESFNMFEVRRAFATRAKEQGFINVLSTEYMLRDYMAGNAQLFENDPKAIPYIVSDYDRTPRNVVLRLFLYMSVSPTSEELIRRELMLVDITPDDDLAYTLWHQLCMFGQPIGSTKHDVNGNEILVVQTPNGELTFRQTVLRTVRKYDMNLGKIVRCLVIDDDEFSAAALGSLKSAQYIAEDETGKPNFLGSELFGHLYQRHLPGQLFTLDGKYYEMLRGNQDGQIIVRRAADHIDGRPTYRQQRDYTFFGMRTSEIMGETRSIGGVKLSYKYADIRVKVDSYWAMQRYNDFSTAKKVVVNGVPVRTYCNKRILVIEFAPELGITPDVLHTLTLMINETFRTIFAENQCFVTAMQKGEGDDQDFGSLSAENGVELQDNCIYIIEDSQLDIGLLTSVERNYRRIFAIICDYLEWHMEQMNKKEEPAAVPEPILVMPEPVAAEEPPEKKSLIRRILDAIKRFFKKLWSIITWPFRKIAGLFKKLFKGKKKDEPETEAGIGTEAGIETGTETGTVTGAEAGGTETEASQTEASQAEETPAQEAPATEIPEVETAEAMAEGTSEDTKNSSHNSVSSAHRYRTLLSIAPEKLMADTAAEGNGQSDDVTFEPEQTQHVDGAQEEGPVKEPKTYQNSYYLLYGRKELKSWLKPEETLAFLRSIGADYSGLKQARLGKSAGQLIEDTYKPGQAGVHYCDFCGKEMTGEEYDVLDDGRERCMDCGKTAIKTQAEFEALYKEVKEGLEHYFGARITLHIDVKMVSTQRLYKAKGKTFVPTPGYDGRVVGFARRNGKKHSLYIENGCPRISAVKTMAHELTHIWQYQEWNDPEIRRKYGEHELEIYEGMAKWAEIQYTYLIGETFHAKIEELNTILRDDEYGRGFVMYKQIYPLSEGMSLTGDTPFNHRNEPIPLK